jgi:hypothetical protein
VSLARPAFSVDRGLATYVHRDRHSHKFCIEADKWSVFRKPMVFNQSLFDSAKKVVVQASIDDENNDFRCSIPVGINIDEAVLC